MFLTWVFMVAQKVIEANELMAIGLTCIWTDVMWSSKDRTARKYKYKSPWKTIINKSLRGSALASNLVSIGLIIAISLCYASYGKMRSVTRKIKKAIKDWKWMMVVCSDRIFCMYKKKVDQIVYCYKRTNYGLDSWMGRKIGWITDFNAIILWGEELWKRLVISIKTNITAGIVCGDKYSQKHWDSKFLNFKKEGYTLEQET